MDIFQALNTPRQSQEMKVEKAPDRDVHNGNVMRTRCE